MEPARELRALAVLQEALDCAADERDAVIAARCAGDAELTAYVERLLRADADAGDFLESPPTAFVNLSGLSARLAGEPAPPVRIGAYRVLRELGSGGMGRVYLAERVDGTLQRTVAIKVVRRWAESAIVLDRFQRERQMLASLEHPGIARLYEAGATDDGDPYFVMEYVAGTSIVAHCHDRQLPIAARLRVFGLVCDAVQFAHQQLIVHRDLKPSNILVTDDGNPKLVDFGIAKLLSPDAGAADADVTLAAARLMTPEYASPEQVRGERVTTASDVYALGAILYELLTGTRPYRLRSRSASDIERAVLDEEPPPPSRAWGPGSRGPESWGPESWGPGAWGPGSWGPGSWGPALAGPNVGGARAHVTLQRALRGDIDVIVLKALQKDPARRYPTVAELADDLHRHLAGLPVRARPDRASYRARKFVRRHRGGVAAAALAVLSLVVGLTVAVWQARVAGTERIRAEQRFNDVRQLANAVVFELHDAIQFLPGATEARQLLVTRALQYLDRLSQEQPADPDLRRELAAAYHRLGDVQGNPLRANLGDTDGALETYRKALALRETLAARAPANAVDAIGLADTEFELGALHRVRGDLPAARRALESMTERLEGVMQRPGHPEVRSKLVAGYQRLAELENLLGQRGGAEIAIAKGLTHGEALVREHPEEAAARLNLSALYLEDRDRLMALNQTREALARSHAARALQEALMATPPLQTPAARALLFTLDGEGRLLTSSGDHAGALRAHQRQWDVARELAERDPRDRFAQLALVVARRSIGRAHRAAGDLPRAIAHLREARHAAERASAEDPANAYARDEVASTVYALADALEATGEARDRRDACEAYRIARDRWRQLQSHGPLGDHALEALAIIESRLAACPPTT